MSTLRLVYPDGREAGPAPKLSPVPTAFDDRGGYGLADKGQRRSCEVVRVSPEHAHVGHELGATARALRHSNGWAMGDVARALELSVLDVSRLEVGHADLEPEEWCRYFDWLGAATPLTAEDLAWGRGLPG